MTAQGQHFGSRRAYWYPPSPPHNLPIPSMWQSQLASCCICSSSINKKVSMILVVLQSQTEFLFPGHLRTLPLAKCVMWINALHALHMTTELHFFCKISGHVLATMTKSDGNDASKFWDSVIDYSIQSGRLRETHVWQGWSIYNWSAFQACNKLTTLIEVRSCFSTSACNVQ